jgi:hypothetical protein
MKIFLKNPNSQLLLQAPNEWTRNPEQALGFLDTAEAVRFALDHSLWKLRVVLHFNDGSQFVRCVVPNRLEAYAISHFERVASVTKRYADALFPPPRAKNNPFALRV